MTQEYVHGYRDFLFYCHALYPAPVAPPEWQVKIQHDILAVFNKYRLDPYITFAGMSQDVATYTAKRASFFNVNFRLTEPFYWQDFHPEIQEQLIADLDKLDVTTYYFGREGDEWLHLKGDDAKAWTVTKQ